MTVFNGNSRIVEEILSADTMVRGYVKAEFDKLMYIKYFKNDYILGNLIGEPAGRAEIVYQRIADSIK